MSLCLFLSITSLGQYRRKILAKSGGFGKKIKSGDGHIGVVVYRKGRGLNLLQTMFIH